MSGAGRDYYSLIARAVEGLDGSTRDYRLALYQRARVAQLNSNEARLLLRRERVAAPEGNDHRGDREGDRSVDI
jgi:hypothetical protein